MSIVVYTALVRDPNDPEPKDVERQFCLGHAIGRAKDTLVNSVVVDGPPQCFDCAEKARKERPR